MVVVHTILEVDIHGHKVPILDEVSCHVHNLVPHKLYDDDGIYHTQRNILPWHFGDMAFIIQSADMMFLDVCEGL